MSTAARTPGHKTTVTTIALREVLIALEGDGHLIRELQVTRGSLFDNPIDKLNAEYIASLAKPAAPVSEWISVDDRLPTDNEDVLALFWPYDNHENTQIVGQCHYVEGEFLTHEGEEHHQPSHWMPLPPAPSPRAAA